MTGRLHAVALLAAFLAGCAPASAPTLPSPAGGGGKITASRASTSTPVASPTPTTSAQLEQRQELSLPQPREELAAAALEGTLFVIAGFDSMARDTNTVFTYSGSWSLGPPLPEALDHPAAAVLQGQLYVAGGFSAGRARATVYRFAQDHWEPVAPFHHPRAAFALIPLCSRREVPLHRPGRLPRAHVAGLASAPRSALGNERRGRPPGWWTPCGRGWRGQRRRSLAVLADRHDLATPEHAPPSARDVGGGPGRSCMGLRRRDGSGSPSNRPVHLDRTRAVRRWKRGLRNAGGRRAKLLASERKMLTT